MGKGFIDPPTHLQQMCHSLQGEKRIANHCRYDILFLHLWTKVSIPKSFFEHSVQKKCAVWTKDGIGPCGEAVV